MFKRYTQKKKNCFFDSVTLIYQRDIGCLDTFFLSDTLGPITRPHSYPSPQHITHSYVHTTLKNKQNPKNPTERHFKIQPERNKRRNQTPPITPPKP